MGAPIFHRREERDLYSLRKNWIDIHTQYRYPELKSLIEAAHVKSLIRQHGQSPEACMELGSITMPDLHAMHQHQDVTEIYKDAEILISSKSWTVVQSASSFTRINSSKLCRSRSWLHAWVKQSGSASSSYGSYWMQKAINSFTITSVRSYWPVHSSSSCKFFHSQISVRCWAKQEA
jgi:hypothetical protein